MVKITDGIYRTRDLSAMGISRTQVSRLVHKGELLRIGRRYHEAYSAEVETHSIHGVDVRVPCVAKTVADCQKYRNRIGLDVAMDALRECIREHRTTIAELNQ